MNILTITLASVMTLGMAAPACYANNTVISSNTHPNNKEWNSAWGDAWKLAGDMNNITESQALANCRDHLMNEDKLFATAGEYKVHVSDAKRDWEIFINSKGNGKGAAGCVVAP